MTKIAFIGGGSVQWTTGLMTDMALTKTLAGAEVVLQDIDPAALKRMTPICKRLVRQIGAELTVRATVDLTDALTGADFVILCVGVGGLAAMRNDLEIPEQYGVYQSVGDTVGPGGLARGLRHIPFAVEVARQMEDRCPEAWLLNLTNPMTTICRGITRATGIRTIGLCHEVTGFSHHLAGLFKVSEESIIFEVAGINHLPLITRCTIDGRDGLAMLRDWLADHDPFEFVDEMELDSVFKVFQDRLAVKLSLFQDLGVLFGAGDRHVCEFLPGYLTAETGYGRRYGVHLTTVDQREQMATERRQMVKQYSPPDQISGEQLAPLMAALLGGPSGQFIVNIPNQGQIDNLPREAVVECMAHVDALGVRPLAVGSLPPAAQAIIAPHVERQELIVETALSGNDAPALAALATDPLLRDPQSAAPIFQALMAANARAMQEMAERRAALNLERLADEMAELSAQPAPEPAEDAPAARSRFSVSRTPLKELLADEAARAILEKHFPGVLDHPQIHMATSFTLRQASAYAPDLLSAEKLAVLEEELEQL